MSWADIWKRIRAIFQSEEDIETQLARLYEGRANSQERRDGIYETITRMEEREQGLVASGKNATSALQKNRLASQIHQLRKEINRQHVLAKLHADRVNIASVDIHNLVLLQEGAPTDLPSAETLTEHAVAAEEMLERLAENADLSGIESFTSTVPITDEERAIMAEFDEEPQPLVVEQDDTCVPVAPVVSEKVAEMV